MARFVARAGGRVVALCARCMKEIMPGTARHRRVMKAQAAPPAAPPAAPHAVAQEAPIITTGGVKGRNVLIGRHVNTGLGGAFNNFSSVNLPDISSHLMSLVTWAFGVGFVCGQALERAGLLGSRGEEGPPEKLEEPLPFDGL